MFQPIMGLVKLITIMLVIMWVIGVMMNTAECGSGLSCP